MNETYFGPISATCFSLPYKRNCPGPLSGPTVTSTGRGYKQRQTICWHEFAKENSLSNTQALDNSKSKLGQGHFHKGS